MGYSLAITAYCQTCNRSHRAKDNEHRLTSAHRVNKRNYKVYSNGAFGKNAPFVVPRYVYAILT